MCIHVKRAEERGDERERTVESVRTQMWQKV